MDSFTPKQLVAAIRALLELNHYEVEESVHIRGAEVDLVARKIGDPFGATLYIEATVERVDVDKYGKDLSKLALIEKLDPSGTRIIVSSSGFTAPVYERAKETGVHTYLYDELFQKFERFEPLLLEVLGESNLARELRRLSHVYEEPEFIDDSGIDVATTYLNSWLANPSTHRWLIVTGEYGTGKTALTKTLLHRWSEDHKKDPSRPIPFRVELRDFTRQFDARGLLHHFLDKHRLGHVSIDFVYSLIRRGRIVLILDGYDEMAQYLSARERRTCLEALAELSADGARGVLTSRPNYFTEAEELQVFEVLYSSFRFESASLTKEAEQILKEEKRVDQLLENLWDRKERRIKDLSPIQTRALVGRLLSHDPHGRTVVDGVLDRVFRDSDKIASRSLSGKPVIISYLVDVVDQLKGSTPDPDLRLTEWAIYKLIVDQLMIRDYKRSPEMLPNVRRGFLQNLAVWLSRRENSFASEDDVKDIVSRVFRRDIERLPHESRHNRLEQLFADTRSSATLTRLSEAGRDGWRFSHNSLREFLVAEAIISELSGSAAIHESIENIAISDAMRTFASSRSEAERRESASNLARRWGVSSFARFRGRALSLLWDGIRSLYDSESDPVRVAVMSITGYSLSLEGAAISSIEFQTDASVAILDDLNLDGAALTQVGFKSASLRNASFVKSKLQDVCFNQSDLSNANFEDSLIIDCSFDGSNVARTNFCGVKPEDISIVVRDDGSGASSRLAGFHALGWLWFHGAKVPEETPSIFRVQNYKRFPIVDKIFRLLSKQTRRQRRGLEQRGESKSDVPFARELLNRLENAGFVLSSTKDTVDVTELGREMFARYDRDGELPSMVVEFLDQ